MPSYRLSLSVPCVLSARETYDSWPLLAMVYVYSHNDGGRNCRSRLPRVWDERTPGGGGDAVDV